MKEGEKRVGKTEWSYSFAVLNPSNRLRSHSCAGVLANRTLSPQAKADSLNQIWILVVPFGY